MDNNIQKIIDFFDDKRVKVRYQDKDLIMITFTDQFADDIKKVPQAKDKIDTLWIYDYDIYKLEGGDLATIRDQLLSVPLGFKPYNDKIILGGGVSYKFGGFLFVTCSYKAFYLPNTKITVYEMPDEDMDEVKSPVIKIKQILEE